MIIYLDMKKSQHINKVFLLLYIILTAENPSSFSLWDETDRLNSASPKRGCSLDKQTVVWYN